MDESGSRSGCGEHADARAAEQSGEFRSCAPSQSRHDGLLPGRFREPRRGRHQRQPPADAGDRLDRVRRRTDLYVQSARRRLLPQRTEDDGRGRQVQLRHRARQGIQAPAAVVVDADQGSGHREPDANSIRHGVRIQRTALPHDEVHGRMAERLSRAGAARRCRRRQRHQERAGRTRHRTRRFSRSSSPTTTWSSSATRTTGARMFPSGSA